MVDPDGVIFAVVEIAPRTPNTAIGLLHHRHNAGVACAACEIVSLRNKIAILEANLAETQAQVNDWTETAAQHCRNEEYYRGLIVKIGEPFGPPAKTSDDGSVQDRVICAKVPELVDALRATLAQAREVMAGITSKLAVAETLLGTQIHTLEIHPDTAGT